MIKPKAVIFDIDDTLVDTTPSYRGAIIKTAERFGGLVRIEDIAEAKAAGDANNDWVLTKDLLAAQNIVVSLEAVTTVFEELYQGTDTVPGLKTKEVLLIDRDMIFAFAAKYELAIVTGRPKRDALDFLVQHDLSSIFKIVVTMDDAPLKPSPIPMQKALAALGESDVWMVGDTPDDIRSAVGAGIIAIGVVAPSDNPVVAKKAMTEAGAKMVLDTTSELEGLLL